MQNDAALAPAADSQAGDSKKPKVRVHSKYILPSDRASFSIHFDLLKRIVLRTRNGQEAITADKAEGEGIPIQAAQMNVRFLKNIGLLTTTDRGLYLPTPETIKFVNARSVDDARAKPILRDILAKTWFAELAQEQFRLDPVMSEDRFIGELALTAETDKSKKEPALRVIVEYLVYSGILARDERGLSLAAPVAPPTTTPIPDPTFAVPAAPLGMTPPAPMPGQMPPGNAEWRVVQTESFQVRVRADIDAIDELVDHLGILKTAIQRKQAKVAPTSDGAATIKPAT